MEPTLRTPRRWLAIALAPLIVVAAALTIASFLGDAEDARSEQLAYSQLQAHTNRLSSLEWQAVAAGGVPAEVSEGVDEAVADIDAQLRRLDALDGHRHPDKATTVEALRRYVDAIERQLGLLGSGDLEAAEEVDEREVDPAYERLHELLRSQLRSHDREADSARRNAYAGALAALLAAALAFGLMLRSFARARERANVAKVQEATLRRSEQRFETMLENSSDLILVVDDDTTVRYQSASVQRVLGCRAGELQGRKLTELAHAEDVLALDMHGAQHAVEVRLRHENGSWVHVELLGRPIVDDDGRPGVVLNGRDVTHRRQLEQELRHQAFHDSLTGLANRALFSDRLVHALDQAPRRQSGVAVLFLDVDDFKLVNDSLGHQAGDDLLCAVAQRMRGAVRKSDTIARFGGDEFAVLLEDVEGSERAEVVARTILEALEQPFTLSSRTLSVRASIGIALGGDSGVTAESLLRDADAAMYAAKHRGKGRYEVFLSEMHTSAVDRLELTRELQQAVERAEFAVHYQPIVEIANGAIAGLEALVRWDHPTRGMVAPAEFLPVAEASGLITPIGAWVLEEACRQAREWQVAYPDTPLSIAVNVSPRQLADAGFAAAVESVLDETGLAAGDLVLELTETTLLEDTEATAGQLERLKQIGVRLAVDDFGTGYSALAYLQRFDVDILKIDKSFVDRIGSGSSSSLVRGIAGLAESLGLEVVAEGIEQDEQVAELVAMQSRLGQGYYFARPLPAAEAERLVSRGCTSVPSPRIVSRPRTDRH